MSDIASYSQFQGLLYQFLALIAIVVGGGVTVFTFFFKKATTSATEAKDAISNFETQTVPKIEKSLSEKIDAQNKITNAQMETLTQAHKALTDSGTRQENTLIDISKAVSEIKSQAPVINLKFEQNDKEHTDINHKIDENHKYNRDWQQRIEDEIDPKRHPRTKRTR